MMKIAVLIFLLCLFWSGFAGALTVGVWPTKSVKVTLADGESQNFGEEVSFQLLNELYHVNGLRVVPLGLYQNPVLLDVDITPKIRTFLFGVGSRSNRIVYGFRDQQMLFDGLDNEFVATPEERSQCERPDFFKKQVRAHGWGPFKSNFGAQFDEGATLSLAGYGFGFKQKRFDIKVEIEFQIRDFRAQTTEILVIPLLAKGRDLFVLGSYDGFSLGLELQSRKTLGDALKVALPLLAQRFVQNFEKRVSPQSSIAPSVIGLGLSEPMDFHQVDLDLGSQIQSAHASVEQLSQCFSRRPNWLEETARGFMALVGWWKYKNIFDQPLRPWDHTPLKWSTTMTKVALVDTGVDYNDPVIGRHVIELLPGKIAGFDFVSWDDRPSDDLGHGTAAAKYLLRKLQGRVAIIPIKVIGSRGETLSSAIFQGLKYSKDLGVKAVIIPWKPQDGTSRAYREGVSLLTDSGIKIYAPAAILDRDPKVLSPQKVTSSRFKTSGLGGAPLRLEPEAVAVLDTFIQSFSKGEL
ncbi:MAG: hypothetical protein IT289_11340 [Oligoflexia bacterium]|nr:hypothetical protein [Oligoflexia bacterium]